MHLRACLYFQDQNELQDFIQQQKESFITFTNKFRACVFLCSENPEADFSNPLAFLNVHNAITQYLSYAPPWDNPDQLQHPQEPILHKTPQRMWIQDVDVWMQLPRSLADQVQTFGSHIFCYDTLAASLRELR